MRSRLITTYIVCKVKGTKYEARRKIDGPRCDGVSGSDDVRRRRRSLEARKLNEHMKIVVASS